MDSFKSPTRENGCSKKTGSLFLGSGKEEAAGRRRRFVGKRNNEIKMHLFCPKRKARGVKLLKAEGMMGQRMSITGNLRLLGGGGAGHCRENWGLRKKHYSPKQKEKKSVDSLSSSWERKQSKGMQAPSSNKSI